MKARDSTRIYQQRINRVIDHIKDHLAEPLPLEKLARLAHFSPFHFHRIFRSLVGEPLHSFIRRLRLEKAVLQMSHGPHATLTEIALRWGFASSSDFQRTFSNEGRFDVKVYMLVVLTLVLCCTPLARCDDAKEDSKLIEGTWLPISAELAGAKFPEESLKVMKLTLKDEKYTLQSGDETDQGTWKLDVSKKPKSMDIKGTEGPNKGKTILTIYQLSDDSLKVCYDLGGKNRPTEFKTKPATQLFLVTYKREKP
jgi:uncharacterized protein (TIGR03067 family)